ncbi:protoporphyrinogen oxidase [Planosporangium flavigriseum]|uniref:Coproporphyrinogen III oxidase n=1 Tax=Planosporangium flavigriseum TaxID=373681 RepID=A0A8J3LWI7_9ACTN|nr:protoporphyrinogen oxidase [Planosporangium flavigriseum]NJC63937.1 protoporphyrinogen oxidase [Planosporangium flavigriseum]GIG74650.1 protoporphyrinogen oxidase [Planosporangium flavigriseum]
MRIVVVGGGISGLAAAQRLVERGAEVVLVEQGSRLGGKLHTTEIAGGPVELGAEAFAVRDPQGNPSAAIELVNAVGLADSLVYPAIGKAALAVDGQLRPMPAGTLMGVPGDLDALDGVAAAAPERDHDGGRPLLGPEEDTGVGVLVRRRLGDEVADRLVDPMLGGVYAGRADHLSLAVTMPALAATARREHTLVGAVRAALAARPASSGPIFGTIVGGVGRLVSAVADRLGGVDLRLGLPVRSITPAGAGWQVTVGSTRDPETIACDAVVLATPATPAARLLAEVAPGASTLVGTLDYASVALVTLALPEVELPELSGLLVPATEGYAVKAATFFDRKWAHMRRPGVTLVRTSLGRYGDERVLQRSDPELVDLAHAELGQLLGRPLPAPIESRVQRWGGALPQYAPGHLERVASARASVPATVALAGAAYDGVGIPACVRSGWVAADRVLEGLTS